MWIRNEDRNGQRIIDEVEIDGTLWVEIPDEKGVNNVQSGIERGSGKDIIQAETALQEAHHKDS